MIAAQTRQEQPRMGSLRLQVVRFLETLVGMDNPVVDQVLIQEVSQPVSNSASPPYFRWSRPLLCCNHRCFSRGLLVSCFHGLLMFVSMSGRCRRC